MNYICGAKFRIQSNELNKLHHQSTEFSTNSKIQQSVITEALHLYIVIVKPHLDVANSYNHGIFEMRQKDEKSNNKTKICTPAFEQSM